MRYILGLLFLFVFLNNSFTQNHKLRAYLDSKEFYAPSQGSYVEFQLQFVGPSINYKGQGNGLIGEVAIQMNISQYDSVIASDAYRLSTPFMQDSIIGDFYDIKRFVLKPGEYKFSIILQDLNSDDEPLETSQNILVEDLSKSISISDIQIAEYASKGDGKSIFYKSGYDIIPRLATFFPDQLSAIPVYFEMYNTDQLIDSIFAVKQTITNALTNEEVEAFTKYTKLKKAEVVPFLKEINIDKLPTGKYILNFTILNKNMIELSNQSYEFDRSKDVEYEYFTDEIVVDPAFQKSITDDSIGYYLESLIPISKSNETKNILTIAKARDLDKARKYIQVYWLRTAPGNAYEEWVKYKSQVQEIEKFFANSFQTGYETDRGRIYLKYGPPSHISRNENSSSEYPYEIWQYNRIGSFNNKRFIFYNPNLTNNTHQLLHSDMIGEIKNLNWPSALSRGSGQDGQQHGSNSIDDFNE
tara:strand:- start:601 stop:2013 length:1413 start_codon:yes stop_codon:yes gene_type:complete